MFHKIRRKLFPSLKLKSNIKEVVYINFLVDIKRINFDIPPEIMLFEINGKTFFTVLTYKHGNFRPFFIEKLKFLFPSAYQSNWRFYVKSFKKSSTQNSIFFVKNILSSLFLTISSRIISDSMNTEHDSSFIHTNLTTSINVHGSCDLQAKVQISSKFDFPLETINHFQTQEKVLKFLCEQNYAYNLLDTGEFCKSEISLKFENKTLVPLTVTEFKSKWIEEKFGDLKPFAFLMKEVELLTLKEEIIN